jgi:YggT family protein
MGGNYLITALIYVIQTLMSLYIGTVMVRFLLHVVGADCFYYNPLARALVSFTNPALRLLRRVIPGYKGIDWAAVLLMLGLQIIESLIISALYGMVPAPLPLILITVAELLRIAVYIFSAAVLLQWAFSWLMPQQYNPVAELAELLAEPILKPARRLLPAMGGFDFSPMLAFIFLNLTLILLVDPLFDLARGVG